MHGQFFSCLPPLSDSGHRSWKLVCVCPPSEKHSDRMKMFTKPSAPSGAKARGRQLKFWAAIVIFATSSICLTGAPDGAQQPGFDETKISPSFSSNNEHSCVETSDVRSFLPKKVSVFGDNLFNASADAPGPVLEIAFNIYSFSTKITRSAAEDPSSPWVFSTTKPFLGDNLTLPYPASICFTGAPEGLGGGELIFSSPTNTNKINSSFDFSLCFSVYPTHIAQPNRFPSDCRLAPQTENNARIT